jgi:hypothetical protein
MRPAHAARPRIAPLVGAASARAACGAPRAPAFPEDAPPAAMQLSVGGFGSGQQEVTLRGDTVIVTRRPFVSPEDATLARVVPSRDAWRAFWRAADAAGVRRWPSTCRNDRIVDGGGYTLELWYPGGRITSSGSNSYPQRDGRCNGDPGRTPEFSAFLAAVSQLIGRSYP